jgi:hypothetical protein
MAEFLVEFYVAESNGRAVRRSARRVLQTAEQATREGTQVRYLRSIFVPADETSFLMLEAAAIDVVYDVVRRAAVRFERITEAVVEPRDDQAMEESRCASPC